MGWPAFIMALIFIAWPAVAWAGPGELDLSLAGTGKLQALIRGGPDVGSSVVRQADGKLVVAVAPDVPLTSLSSFTLVRYAADGTLDPTFGDQGIVRTGQSCACSALVLLPDGKLLAGGVYSRPGLTPDAMVVRYLPDGSPDPTFGNAGTGVLNFTSPQYARLHGFRLLTGANGKIHLATGNVVAQLIATGALDPSFSGDGKVEFTTLGQLLNVAILVQGTQIFTAYTVDYPARVYTEFVRYNADGSRDSTLPANAELSAAIHTEALALQVSSTDDQRIVGVGWNVPGASTNPPVMAVFRLDALTGTQDSTFGGDGIVIPGLFGKAYDVKLLRNNFGQTTRMVIGGGSNQGDFVTARLMLDGTLDSSFNATGSVRTPLQEEPGSGGRTLLLQPDGKIVVAGKAGPDMGIVRYTSTGALDPAFSLDGKRLEDVAHAGQSLINAWSVPDGSITLAGQQNLARFLPDGTLDPAFDEEGTASIGFSISAAAHWPDRRIYVMGYVGPFDTAVDLAAFLPHGARDPAFGTAGSVSMPLASGSSLNSLAVQPDGSLVLGGTATVGAQKDFLLMRLTPAATLDNSFDFDGKILTDFNNGEDVITSLLIQPDGAILAGGVIRIAGHADIALARYHPDGSVDNSFSFDGKTSIPVSAGGEDTLRSMTFAQGKILLAGNAAGTACVVRLLADGSLDSTLDGDGKLLIDFGTGGPGDALGVATDTQGRILVTGSARTSGTNSIIAAARFLANGMRDPSYGTNGLVFVSFGGSLVETGKAIMLDRIGRTVVAGTSANLPTLARFTGDPFATLTGITRNPITGGLLLEGLVAPGYSNLLQQSPSLLPSTFQPSGSVTPDAGGRWLREIPPVPPRQFFRLTTPAPP